MSDEILIIDLDMHPPIQCRRCGVDAPHKWAVPVNECGDIIPTWSTEEWAGMSVCEACFEWHRKWSETTAKSPL